MDSVVEMDVFDVVGIAVGTSACSKFVAVVADDFALLTVAQAVKLAASDSDYMALKVHVYFVELVEPKSK